MQKIIILLLILFVINCRHKKVKKLWEFPTKSNSESFFFSYGNKNGEDTAVNPEQPPSWGPAFRESGSEICLYSHDAFFYPREYGPSFGICIEPTLENKNLIESGLHTLNELDESKIRPDGNLINKGAKIHLSFLSLTEIVNEISNAKSKSFLLGDNRLHFALEKRMDFSYENYRSISGTKDKKIETSFSLPYFSVYEIDGIYKIAFPPLDSGIPRSQYHYLILEVTNLSEFISIFKENFESIQKINETWATSCSHEKIEITEAMGYASGSTKRFIEWTGSKENANCLDNLSLTIAEKNFNLETNSPFLFPGAVKLFVEESSPLQGIVVKDLNWKDIKSESTLQLTVSEMTDTWKLPENVNFHWSDDEFSIKKKTTICEWTSSIMRNSKLCGDPGIDFDSLSNIATATGPDGSISSGMQVCKPEDFALSELNAYGLKIESKLDRTGKFIELLYIGESDCKLSGLNLVIGNIPVPFFEAGAIVKVNSIWVVSDGKHYTGLKSLIKRNIDFLQWQSSITLKSLTSAKSLWKGLKSEEVFLPESMNRSVHSMVIVNDRIFHHPNKKPFYLQAAFRSNHFMSPGEVNIDFLPDASGELSEVLWAGAYKNNTSIPSEKFIELKTKGDGTLELEVSAGSKLSRFYIPVSRNDSFTVLSKEVFQCFPNSRSIVSDLLELSDESTNLKLKLEGKILSEINYSASNGNGFSNSSLKLRASFVNSGVLGNWRTASNPTQAILAAECKGQVFATPEAPNEFEPFLVDEFFDFLGTGRFNLAASSYDANLPYSIWLYSYLPDQSSYMSLEKNGIGTLLKPIESLLNTTGLFYQKLENYSDLKLYNRDGIFIEGVMTNPSNSQNEWILFCNRGKVTRDISEYEIQDENSVDQIDSYFKRKKISLPTGISKFDFYGNSTILLPGQCGYLVDPDASALNLRQKGIAPTLVFTVRTSSTIGNGISSEEALDLFKISGHDRIHIHSFGNKFSHARFTIPVSTDEIILLLPERRGEGRYDYEIVKW